MTAADDCNMPSGQDAGDDTTEPVRLLSVADVSELLQIPVATIYRWRHRGEGPNAMRIGRYLRFHPADIGSWVEQRRVVGRSSGQATTGEFAVESAARAHGGGGWDT